MSSINVNDEIFKVWEENYLQGSASKRKSCIIKDFKRELGLRKDYQGREILEMIQNADDQQSSTFRICLSRMNGECSLSFTNSGADTRPFTKAGFQSIMCPDLSSKQMESGGYEEVSPIGNKGLGFRSLLNWSNHIEILSAGLHCTFKAEFAEHAWETIRNSIERECVNEGSTRNNWIDLLRDCESVMQATGSKCPISILAVPEVIESDTPNDATTIIVHFREELLDSIRTQLKGLRANSLLFVKHLEMIIVDNQIDADRFSYSVQKKKNIELDIRAKEILGEGGSISTCIIDYGDRKDEWMKFAFKDDSSELAIAWLQNGQVCAEDRVVHCFFPTQVQLNLPCVLHGSFDVDSSRNRILASSSTERPNEVLLEKAGRCLVHVAEYRALRDAQNGRCSWDPYGMVNLGTTKLVAPMDCLKRGIDSELEKRNPKIYPTVSGTYRPFDNTCCYGESLAAFLKRDLSQELDPQGNGEDNLGGHLIPGFTENNLFARNDDRLTSRVEQTARVLSRTCQDPLRGQRFHDFLEALIEVKSNFSPSVNLKIPCLPDETGEIQKDTVYVHCGIELVNAKELLGIHYIDSALYRVYESEVGSKKEWDNGRWLASHLSEIALCVPSDISSMKERVCTITKDEKYRDVEFFKKIIASLFATYEKNSDMAAMGEKFNVLDKDGHIKPACAVCLFDDERTTGLAAHLDGKPISSKWWLMFGLNEWCGYLNAERELVTRFLIEFLGVRRFLPIQYSRCDGNTWGLWEPYLRQQLGNALVNDGPWNYTVERLKGHCDESEYNREMMIDDEFISELVGSPTSLKDLLSVIRLLHKDEECRRELLKEPVFRFFKNTLQVRPMKSSWMSYRLCNIPQLSLLRQYAVDEDCSTDGTQISKDKYLGKVPLDERRAFLCKMGASPRLSEMPPENLYRMLAQRRSRDGIQNFYKRIREALVRQRDRLPDEESRKQFERECHDLARGNLAQLYARNQDTNKVELKDRETIRYWDNDILSKAILGKQFKLEIGSRVGAASVETFFAVKPLGHDLVTVDDANKVVNEDLTKAFCQHLEDRKTYLLALRCRTLDESKIKDAVSQIVGLKVEIVSRCAYYLKDNCQKGDDAQITMENGDLIQTPNGFIICSTAVTLDQALAEARFCLAVSEMLCIRFGLTGTEIATEFRNVIMTADQNLDICRASDLTIEEWERAKQALGLSPSEKAFWEVVLNRDLSPEEEHGLMRSDSRPQCITKLTGKEPIDGIALKSRLVETNPQEFVLWFKWLKISLKSFMIAARQDARLEPFVDCLCEWFNEKKRYIHDAYQGEFMHELHKKLKDTDQSHRRDYALKVEEYSRGSSWYSTVKDDLFKETELPDDGRFLVLFFETVKKNFDLELTEKSSTQLRPELEPCESYKQILKILCPGRTINALPAAMRSLVFFEGNENSFKDELGKFLDKEETGPSQVVDTAPELSRDIVPNRHNVNAVEGFPADFFKDHKRAKNTGRPTGLGKGASYDTKTRQEHGRQAELIVWEYLNRDTKKYTQLQAKSSMLNTKGTADDSCHYDIRYLTPEGEERYVEVKACDGHGFFMSHGEYDFATNIKNRGKYVLALVVGNKIVFLESPFDPASPYKSHFVKKEDTWLIDIIE